MTMLSPSVHHSVLYKIMTAMTLKCKAFHFRPDIHTCYTYTVTKLQHNDTQLNEQFVRLMIVGDGGVLQLIWALTIKFLKPDIVLHKGMWYCA